MLNTTETATCPDPYSYHLAGEPTITHVVINVTVDFQARTLRCATTYTLSAPATVLHLDTRDLTIFSVSDDRARPIPFLVAEAHPLLGSELALLRNTPFTRFTITYVTS